jgi:hypothetical protein
MAVNAANVGFLLGQLLSWLLAALRLIVKVVAGGLAVVAVALLLGFIAYDVLYFQPHRPQIAQLIAAATEEERNPPEVVVHLICADHSPDPISWRAGVSSHAARILILELGVRGGIRGADAHFHALSALWWLLTWAHLSEREQIALLASRLYMGRGLRGYSAASQALFNRPLALLSPEEAATIVALPFMPSRYHSRPDKLAQRRDSLLTKMRACP